MWFILVVSTEAMLLFSLAKGLTEYWTLVPAPKGIKATLYLIAA